MAQRDEPVPAAPAPADEDRAPIERHEIVFTGVPSADDLSEVAFLPLSGRRSWLILLGLILLAFCWIAVITMARQLRAWGLAGEMTAILWSALGFAVLFGLVMLILKWQQGKRQQASEQDPIHYRLSAHGMRLEDANNTFDQPWSFFSSWFETERNILLMDEVGMVRLVPKRFLPSDWDLRRLRGWLRARLGDPGGTASGSFPVIPDPKLGTKGASASQILTLSEVVPDAMKNGAGEAERSVIEVVGPVLWEESREGDSAADRWQRHIFRWGPPMLAVAAFVFVALVGSGLADDPELRSQLPTMVFAGASAAAWFALDRWWRRMERRQYEARLSDVRYRFDPDGLRVEQWGQVIEASYVDLRSWRQGKSTFVLYLPKKATLLVPLRLLDADQKRRIEEWLTAVR